MIGGLALVEMSLCLVAIACIAATVWLWKRLPGPHFRLVHQRLSAAERRSRARHTTKVNGLILVVGAFFQFGIAFIHWNDDIGRMTAFSGFLISLGGGLWAYRWGCQSECHDFATTCVPPDVSN